MEIIVFLGIFLLVALFVVMAGRDKNAPVGNMSNSSEQMRVVVEIIDELIRYIQDALKQVEDIILKHEEAKTDWINDLETHKTNLIKAKYDAEQNKAAFIKLNNENYALVEFDKIRNSIYENSIFIIMKNLAFQVEFIHSEKPGNGEISPQLLHREGKAHLIAILSILKNIKIARYIQNPKLLDDAESMIFNFMLEIASIDDRLSESEVDYLNALYGKDWDNEQYLLHLQEQKKYAATDDAAGPINQAVELINAIKTKSEVSASLIHNELQELSMTLIAVDRDRDDRELEVLGSYIDQITHNAFGSAKAQQASDVKAGNKATTSSESGNEKSFDELMNELNELIGLDDAKQNVLNILNSIRVNKMREDAGMKVSPVRQHLVFTGNPGTGKTTVARILAAIYRELGILSKGHLIEVSRHSLVAGYVGQTALKTQEVIDSAMGGILFVDEAYSLAKTHTETDFGSEAIETLLKSMEDNRDDLIVIAAGYPNEMANFIHSNPGLRSRFTKYIHFDDYSANELHEILKLYVEKNGYQLSGSAEQSLREIVKSIYDKRGEHFGNARTMRTLFETLVQQHSNRVITIDNPSNEDLTLITVDDMPGYELAEAVI